MRGGSGRYWILALLGSAACTALTGVDDLSVGAGGVADASASSSSGAASSSGSSSSGDTASGSSSSSSSSSTSSGSSGIPDAGEPDADASGPEVDSGNPPPPTPIAFVQSNTIKPAGTLTTLAFTKAVAAHDGIVVCLNYPSSSGATLSKITDTLGNTYGTVVGPIVGNTDDHYIAVALDSAAGNDTLSVVLSVASTGGSDLLVLEYSGLSLTNAFDVSASSSGTGTVLNSGATTTSFAHELIIGYAEAASAVAGSGFTGRATVSGNLVEDKVVTSVGPYAATATSGSGGWEMLIATFRGQ